MKLRTRISLIICSMIAALMAILGGIIYIKSAAIIDKDAEEFMISQLERMQENIDLLVKINTLETRELALDKMVQAFMDKEINTNQMNNYLMDLMNKKNRLNNYYMDLFIVNREGRIIATCMPVAMNLDLSGREYIIKSSKTRDTVTSDVLIAKSNGQLIVNTVSPIINLKGEVLGYAGISMYAEYFSKIVNSLKLGQTGYYVIIDSKNLILSHPRKNLIGKPSILDVNLTDFKNHDIGYEKIIKKKSYSENGEREFQVFKLMKNKNWVLAAILPEKEMYKQSASLLNSVIFIGFAAIAVAIMVGIYVTKKISTPIAAVTEYMDAITNSSSIFGKSISESIDILKNTYKDIENKEENYDYPVVENDEMGKLESSFKNLKKVMWIMLGKFEKESKQLIRTSEQLALTIDEITLGTSRFISTLSHDLKNSITVIKGYSKGLKSGLIQDKNVEREFIDGIYSRTEELEGIILDVLDSAYEAQGNIRLNKEFVKAEQFCNELIESAHQYINSNGLICKSKLQIKEGFLKIDSTKIKRVWNNLVNNAVKYSGIGREINISIIQNGDKIVFKVMDEGLGIDKDELDKIFNMFYRGNNVTNKGYGLGLFISKSIIEAHDSALIVKSEKGKGSTFQFSLKTYINNNCKGRGRYYGTD